MTDAPKPTISLKKDQGEFDDSRQKQRLFQEIRERGELHLQYLSLLEQQEALLSSIPAYIYVKDIKNNIIVANELFMKAFGLNAASLPRPHSLAINAEGIEALLEDDEEILQSNRVVTLEERVIAKVSGDKHWFWVSKIPFFSPDEQLLGLVGSILDISDIKQTQLALQQNEILIRSLAERSFSAIFILQCDRLFYINPLFESSFSIPPQTPCQTIDLFALFAPEDGQKLKKKCHAIEHEGLNTSRFLLSAHPLDRSNTLIFEIYLTQIDYHAAPAVLGSLLDVTDKYQASLTLEAKAKELEALNQDLEKRIENEVQHRIENEKLLLHQSRLAAMGEMIEAIAHQWRQPLTTLSIMIQNLENSFAFNRIDENQINRFIDESHLHIRRMTESIDQFGHFFSPSREESPPLSWFSLLHEAILIYTTSCPTPPLNLTIAPELQTIRCTVQVNAFKQVMLSLLNLLTFPNPTRSHLPNEVSLTAKKTQDMIVLELTSLRKASSDDNPSPPDHYAITLTMCKKLVEEHMGGHFLIRQDNDSALEFLLELPIK